MYYNQSPEQLAQELGTNLETGLTNEEYQKNLKKYGYNELPKEKQASLLVRFLLQFKEVLTIILIFAAIISVIVDPHEVIDSIIILVVVVLNAILGLIQENNAQKALAELEKMSSPYAKVIRDGQTISIEAKEVVPGDIIVLEAGDSIPSDGRIIASYNLKVDESALTGESVPVDKIDTVLDQAEASLGDRINMVYASCNVTYGRGLALVVTSGSNNEIGKIASMLKQEKPGNTPLQDRLDQIGKMIGAMCIGICMVVFVLEVMTGLSYIDAFKTAVALAVAAIPEGLATVVTVVLALSVQRMVKKNAIIKKLPAVETLGSTSVVCSDKTGTLTQNKMTLVKAYLPNQEVKIVDGDNDPDLIKMLNYFTLCSDGKITTVDGEEQAIGDPTETALVKASLNKGYSKEDLEAKLPRVSELAFDSERKMMTVFVQQKDRILQITKGGPDVIFDRCTGIDIDQASQANIEMSQDALRVLAIGVREWDELPGEINSEAVENELTFVGLIGMIDPPRQEAKAAIAEAKRAGVRTVMITGDHVVTASAIARELGILRPGDQAIMGSELEKMSDDKLKENIENYSVYARVAPEHKVRIVKAWQSKGKVVAMTGDGVNDSPALNAADIGCAMGITGTDVAKGAASMILTDDNFATIIQSIKEGRGIYDNIKKDVQFLLSGNIGEVVCIFLASIISLIFAKEHLGSPLLPIHLLWVNLITDSLPAFALGFEPVESDVMDRKPRPKDESFFANGLGFRIVWQGLMIGGLTLVAYYIGNANNHYVGMTMAFLTLCGTELVHSFNVKSNHSILGKNLFTNKYLFYSLFVGLGLQIILVTVPFLRNIFKLHTLDINQLLIVIGLCFSTVIFSELEKAIRNRLTK